MRSFTQTDLGYGDLACHGHPRIRTRGYGPDGPETHETPLLYHLGKDPSERFDVAKEQREVVGRIRETVAKQQAGLKAAPSQLLEFTEVK